MIQNILQKSIRDEPLTDTEIRRLFQIPLFTQESMQIISTARMISTQVSKGVSEVHAQIGLNNAPCSLNCLFCSFA